MIQNEKSLQRNQAQNRHPSSADDWLSSLLTQTNSHQREAQLSHSLQTLRHEMGQIAASLNLRDQKPSLGINKDPASILADIERRQSEILNGLKKPHTSSRDNSYFEEKPYQAPLIRDDFSNSQFTNLGEILADIIPEKTVSALRYEWQAHSENLLNRPIERLNDMEAEIRAVSLKINRLSERELSSADAHKLNEMLSLLKQNNAQNLHSFHQLEQSLTRLVQHLDKPVAENNDFLRLENKFEQLAAHILQQSNETKGTSDAEKALILLLKKLEVTDRKIDLLIHKNGDNSLIKSEEEPQKETTQYKEPVYTHLKPATERLNARFNLPQKTEAEQVHVKPMPQFSTALDTGTIPFDMPLEPGRGSPRLNLATQRESYFNSDIFEESPPVKAHQESLFKKSLINHRSKIITALSAILILFGSLKAVSYLQDAEKTPVEKTTSNFIAPPKKIETTSLLNNEPAIIAPRAIEARKNESPLFAPEKKNEIVVPPAVKVSPGVALNDGWQAVNGGDKSDPINTLKALAANNNPSAQFELANKLYDKTPQESVKLYQQAAEQNFAPAQFRLGSLYEKGLTVTKDQEKARKLYLAAASLGHAKAMHNLAVLNADNSEGKADLRASAQWFRRAAEHGVTDSQYNLAVLHARGMGVEQSLTESYKWFALAALGGDKDAALKRDDLEKRLSPETLSAAKMAVETFVPRLEPVAANKIDLPSEITGKNNLLTRPITGKQI